MLNKKFLDIQKKYIDKLEKSDNLQNNRTDDKISSVNQEITNNVTLVNEPEKTVNNSGQYDPAAEFGSVSENKSNDTAIKNTTGFKRVYDSDKNSIRDRAAVSSSELHRIKKKIRTKSEMLKIIFYSSGIILIFFMFVILVNRKSGSAEYWNSAVKYHADAVNNPELYNKAIEEYSLYISKNDNQEKNSERIELAHFYTALCYFELKNYEKCIQILNKIIDNNYDNLTGIYSNPDICGQSFFWIGKTYIAQSLYNEALEVFKVVTLRFPDNIMVEESYKNIILIYRKNSEWNRIVELCNDIINSNLINVAGDFYYFLAESYEKISEDYLSRNDISQSSVYLSLAKKYYKIILSSKTFNSRYVAVAREKLYKLQEK